MPPLYTRQRILPGLAKAAAASFLLYGLAASAATGANLPQTLFSPAGLLLSAAAGALMAASAMLFLAGAGSRGLPLMSRIGRALVWLGLAVCFAGVPRSLAARVTHNFAVGEEQTIPAGYREGLPELRFGRITIAPVGDNIFLSKRVNITTTFMTMMGAVKTVRVGLFPTVRAGEWRLSINKFGYAPSLEWKNPSGEPLLNSWVMLGTFQHTSEEAGLVSWTPAPNLMLGVGWYPPKIEDLIKLPGGPWRVFIRIDEAAVNGARRDLRDPDAYRFMADGRLENPIYSVQIFQNSAKIFEGRAQPGEKIEFPGGSLSLSSDILLWVEIQAVKDKWLSLVAAGAALAALGGALLGAARLGCKKG